MFNVIVSFNSSDHERTKMRVVANKAKKKKKKDVLGGYMRRIGYQLAALALRLGQFGNQK